MTDDALIKKIAKAYSTALALRLVQGEEGPFARVIEHVEIDHGECRRRLVLDWHLPTLAEALPDHEKADDPDFVKAFNEANPVLVVPIHVMRRGRLMTDFTVEDPKGEHLYVCGARSGENGRPGSSKSFGHLSTSPPTDSVTTSEIESSRRNASTFPCRRRASAKRRRMPGSPFGDCGRRASRGSSFIPGPWSGSKCSAATSRPVTCRGST